MPLTKPTLTTVQAGAPITAQGWNTIVDGLDDLFDAVLAIGDGTLAVNVTAAGAAKADAPPDAQVVAAPAGGGPPIVAVPPHGDVGAYVVAGVSDGNWVVHVTAPGFTPKAEPVTLPAAEPLAVVLDLAGVLMPDLFGRSAQFALTALAEAGVQVDLVVDAFGNEVSAVRLPPQYANVPVLAQSPPAGSVLDPGSDRAQLAVAAVVTEEPTATVPSLAGLTVDEAIKVLSGLGLKLGTVSAHG